MQFIFGDNKSKYDLLFADGKESEAKTVKDMIRLSFGNLTETRDVFGYMSFGANSNRPLWFHAQKDLLLKRDVYILHAFYRDLLPEYFFGSDYVSDMFLRYIDQDTFNGLREAPDGFSFTPTVDTDIMAREADLSREKLIEILSHLYQRSKLVIVVDDDVYHSDYARVLLRRVFEYLTPSLRKIASYVVGMFDTESMSFMIRVIPRSMYKKEGTACVDLQQAESAVSPTAQFYKIAERIVEMSKEERDWLFELYESVFYGKESTYQKQNFVEFLANVDNNSETEKEGFETLLTEFLEDSRYNEENGIPEILRSELEPLYQNPAYVERIANFDAFTENEPFKYFEDCYTEIRKVYFLADPKLAFFKNKIDVHYDSIAITGSECKLKRDMHTAYYKQKEEDEDIRGLEEAFRALIEGAIDTIYGRTEVFLRLAKNEAEIAELVKAYLKPHDDVKHVLEGTEKDSFAWGVSERYCENHQAEIDQNALDRKNLLQYVLQKIVLNLVEDYNTKTRAYLKKCAEDKLDRQLEDACAAAVAGFDGMKQAMRACEAAVNAGEMPAYYESLLKATAAPAILSEKHAEDKGNRMATFVSARAPYLADHILYMNRVSEDFFGETDRILEAASATDAISENLRLVSAQLLERAQHAEELAAENPYWEELYPDPVMEEPEAEEAPSYDPTENLEDIIPLSISDKERKAKEAAEQKKAKEAEKLLKARLIEHAKNVADAKIARESEKARSVDKYLAGAWVWIPYIARYASTFTAFVDLTLSILENAPEALRSLSGAELNTCVRAMKLALFTRAQQPDEEELVALMVRLAESGEAFADRKNAKKLLEEIRGYLLKPSAPPPAKEKPVKEKPAKEKTAKEKPAAKPLPVNEEPEAEPISEEPFTEDAPVKEAKPGDPQNKKQLLIICGAAAAITLLIVAVCLFFLFGSGKSCAVEPLAAPAEAIAAPAQADADPAESPAAPADIPTDPEG
jgi:hypothetical protein